MATEKAKIKVTLDGDLMFPSDYLGAPDFKGKDFTLIIESVSKQELQMVGGKKKVKPVLTFKGAKKKLVCNSTNAQSIAFLYGKEANAWIGKAVTLYPTTTTFGRQTVECVRIREKVPPAANQPANGEGATHRERIENAPPPKFQGIAEALGTPPAPPIQSDHGDDDGQQPPDDADLPIL